MSNDSSEENRNENIDEDQLPEQQLKKLFESFFTVIINKIKEEKNKLAVKQPTTNFRTNTYSELIEIFKTLPIDIIEASKEYKGEAFFKHLETNSNNLVNSDNLIQYGSHLLKEIEDQVNDCSKIQL